MRTKFILLTLLTLPWAVSAQTVVPGTEHRLYSPDGAYSFMFYQKTTGESTSQIYYTLTFNGQTVVEESTLGTQIVQR